MINKRNTWALAVAVTVIIFLVLYNHQESADESVAAPIPTEEGKEREDIHVRNIQESGKYNGFLDTQTVTPEEEALRPDETSEANWRTTVFFHRQNVRDQNGPVRFYGKVVDQNGEPVVGADVFGSSGYYVESLSEQLKFGGGKKGTKKIEVKTDKNGLFVVDGYRATNLSYTEIRKDGYRAEEKLLSGLIFGNAFSKRYESDPLSPVIFPMWKKGDTEPLIKARWRKNMVPDGTAYTLDIESGRVVGNGNLSVSILADYDAIPDMNKYPWKLEVSSPGGAVIESNDDFLYKAPDSGYVDSLKWEVEEGNGWRRDIKRSLYLKLRDGSYAAVTINAKVYHTNEARIVVNLIINPSGSPNLEYDPSKELKGQK